MDKNAIRDDILGTITTICLIIAMIVMTIDAISSVISSIIPNDKKAMQTEHQFAMAQAKDGLQPEIIYDKATKVMYIINDSGYITPLLNEDGSPVLYEETSD